MRQRRSRLKSRADAIVKARRTGAKGKYVKKLALFSTLARA